MRIAHTTTRVGRGRYGFERDSEELLRATYRSVLAECALLECSSLAMPAIGCGVQGWRPAFVARVALEAVEAHNASPWGGVPSRIDVLFNSESAWRGFRAVAEKQLGPSLTTTAPQPASEGPSNHNEVRQELLWELCLDAAPAGLAPGSSGPSPSKL